MVIKFCEAKYQTLTPIARRAFELLCKAQEVRGVSKIPTSFQDVIDMLFIGVGGLVVYAGGSAAIAYALFKFFGESWLKSRFDKHLEAYKHAQQTELEHLKFKINALLDRSTKLHQKEFEVLPTAWARLAIAYEAAMALLSSLQMYPDLNRMNDEQLEEFLEDKEFKKWQKTELMQASNKTMYFSDFVFWQRYKDTRIKFSHFSVYLLENGIFIHADMKTKFTELDNIIYRAVLERELNQEMGRGNWEKTCKEALNNRGTELLRSIESDVQNRLWNSENARL